MLIGIEPRVSNKFCDRNWGSMKLLFLAQKPALAAKTIMVWHMATAEQTALFWSVHSTPTAGVEKDRVQTGANERCR